MRLEDSVLGRLARDLPAGEFRRVDAGLPEGTNSLKDLFRVRVDDGRTLSIDGWTDSAHWDPKRKRTFFIGMRQYKKFISYDLRQNAWSVLGWAGNPPPRLERFGHVYGRTALDWRRGHYYWSSPGNVLNRYHIDDARWEAFDNVPISGYISMEWHESLDELVAIMPGGQMRAFKEGVTRSIGQAGVDGYHSVGRFNRVRGDMLFAGGNQSKRRVTGVSKKGEIVEYSDAPFDISIRRISLTYDPVSGNYLFLRHESRELYEFDPDADQWHLVRRWKDQDWPFGKYGFFTPIVIDELRVIFWQSEQGCQIYRHRLP